MRRLLGRLRPRQLDDLTLEQAVRSLMREMELEDRGMVSHLAWRIDESLLSENQRVTLFRVCQEGLNNIVKHASASAVTHGRTLIRSVGSLLTINWPSTVPT